MFYLKILLTLAVGSFILWGYWHEDRFIAFEDRIIEKVKEWVK